MNKKIIKGVYHQIREASKVTFGEHTDIRSIKDQLTEIFEKGVIQRLTVEKERNARVKLLQAKAKNLNKPVPDELLVAIWLNQPQGSWFFEKYKEWFE